MHIEQGITVLTIRFLGLFYPIVQKGSFTTFNWIIKVNLLKHGHVEGIL
jgi:hypothetical protein